MYDDSPDWRLITGLFECLYHEHPIRSDIAGTVESIAEITPEMLYDSCKAFYAPGNMVLAAAGDKLPTGELIAEVMLSDAKYHTPLLRPYMEGGERSDMPYINFYLDYFAQGRPAFVPVEYMDYRDAVELVRDNGGVPVVAHPGLNFRGREEVAGRLLDRGAAGLEVFNNYHTPEQAVYFTSLALSKDAFMTCGSDFHGKTKPRIAVGRFPADSRFDGRLSDFVNHVNVIGRQGV